jgi:hypothetical protein
MRVWVWPDQNDAATQLHSQTIQMNSSIAAGRLITIPMTPQTVASIG